jgi:hypothetical protein
MPAPTYIISKVADPIFAVFIGMSAALTRINREEKAKGNTTQQTIDNGLRYVRWSTVGSDCNSNGSPQTYRLVEENGMISINAYHLNACK